MKKFLAITLLTCSFNGFSESYGSGGGFESAEKAPVGNIVNAGIFNPWPNDPKKNIPSKNSPKENTKVEQADPKAENDTNLSDMLRTSEERVKLREDFTPEINKTSDQTAQPDLTIKTETTHTNETTQSSVGRDEKATDPYAKQNQENWAKSREAIVKGPDGAYLDPQKINIQDLKSFSEIEQSPEYKKTNLTANDTVLMDWEMGGLKVKNGYIYDNWGNKVGKHMYDSKYFKQTGHSGNNFIYFDQDYKVNGQVLVKAGSYKSLTTGALYNQDGIKYGQVIPHGNLRKSGFSVNTFEKPRFTQVKENPLQIKADRH
jgi:hypothetical protein